VVIPLGRIDPHRTSRCLPQADPGEPLHGKYGGLIKPNPLAASWKNTRPQLLPRNLAGSRFFADQHQTGSCAVTRGQSLSSIEKTLTGQVEHMAPLTYP